VVWLFFIVEPLWIVALGSTIWLSSISPIRSWRWLVVFLVGIFAGLIGLFSAYQVSWSPSPTIRYLGFPFPAMLWQLEDGRWVDYVGTPITAVMDVALFVAVATLPLLAWIIVGYIRQSSSATNSSSSQT
jgi:hypothetical protein